jgi:hypothetical protein
MNDNLRYISLQYIKGTNYEEITCFDFERITKLLDIQGDLSKYPKQSVESLKNVKEEDRCKIGESFLNDLVNYYNFKDVKKKLERSREKVNFYIEYDFENKYNYGKYSAASVSLYKLINERERALKSKAKREEAAAAGAGAPSAPSAAAPGGDVKEKDFKELNELKNKVKESLDKLKEGTDEGNQAKLEKVIVSKIETVKERLETNTDFDPSFIKELKGLKGLLLNEAAKNKLYYLAEKKALDNLIILLNSYIKLCVYNISKYDNIFQQNDISNIDDAFMIESYSKFLKKLDRLKRNLESKDEGRLIRDLTHTLDRLFNLYGVNDPEKLLKGDANNDAVNYIANHILNYK